MSRIEELTDELKTAILESPEYKEYIELEELISRQPDLKRDVDEFRKLNFEIQYSDETADVFTSSMELNNHYREMRLDPLANRFLNAEMCLCRMIQNICIGIVEPMKFDVDFLK